MIADLSPAAQAVLDDAHNRWLDVDDDIPAQVAAAALLAAADQVVPAVDDREWWPGNCCERNIKAEQQDIRRELLAIAAELEAANG